MTTPAHPQRCETCNKCEKSKDNPNWIYCKHIRKQPITHDFETFIAWRGCASHSSAQSRDQVLEQLDDLRKYANGEFTEAHLSDNEREMRIHLEYENRIWAIMIPLRTTQGSRDP